VVQAIDAGFHGIWAGQFIGFDILLADIVRGFGPLSVDRIVEVYADEYGRTSGATRIPLPLPRNFQRWF